MANTKTFTFSTPEEKKGEMRCLIQKADSYFGAAQHLHQSSFVYIYPAVVLVHHRMELILKAYCIWYNGKYNGIHNLPEIQSEIQDKKFQEIIDPWTEFIKRINTFFYYRYPISKDVATKIENSHKAFAPKTNILCQAGEVGTNDIDDAIRTYENLLNEMPDDMCEFVEIETCVTIVDFQFPYQNL